MNCFASVSFDFVWFCWSTVCRKIQKPLSNAILKETHSVLKFEICHFSIALRSIQKLLFRFSIANFNTILIQINTCNSWQNILCIIHYSTSFRSSRWWFKVNKEKFQFYLETFQWIYFIVHTIDQRLKARLCFHPVNVNPTRWLLDNIFNIKYLFIFFWLFKFLWRLLLLIARISSNISPID